MVLKRVTELLAQNLEIDEATLNPQTKLIEDLGADSLDAAELITALEDEYSIIVDEKELVCIKTIQDIVDLIEARI